jgi:hypothetical protein
LLREELSSANINPPKCLPAKRTVAAPAHVRMPEFEASNDDARYVPAINQCFAAHAATKGAVPGRLSE